MAMLQEKYGIRPTSEMLGCGYRSLIIDQFAGQITPGAFAEMPAPRKIPLVIRGQLTPYPQAADRRHNQIFKKVYAQLEAVKRAKIMAKHLRGIHAETQTMHSFSKTRLTRPECRQNSAGLKRPSL